MTAASANTPLLAVAVDELRCPTCGRRTSASRVPTFRDRLSGGVEQCLRRGLVLQGLGERRPGIGGPGAQQLENLRDVGCGMRNVGGKGHVGPIHVPISLDPWMSRRSIGAAAEKVPSVQGKSGLSTP